MKTLQQKESSDVSRLASIVHKWPDDALLNAAFWIRVEAVFVAAYNNPKVLEEAGLFRQEIEGDLKFLEHFVGLIFNELNERHLDFAKLQ